MTAEGALMTEGLDFRVCGLGSKVAVGFGQRQQVE